MNNIINIDIDDDEDEIIVNKKKKIILEDEEEEEEEFVVRKDREEKKYKFKENTNYFNKSDSTSKSNSKINSKKRHMNIDDNEFNNTIKNDSIEDIDDIVDIEEKSSIKTTSPSNKYIKTSLTKSNLITSYTTKSLNSSLSNSYIPFTNSLTNSLTPKIQQPWHIKYLPTSISALSIHSNFIKSLTLWFETYILKFKKEIKIGSKLVTYSNKLPICLLVGPVGCGKNTLISVLSKDLNIDIVEYSDNNNINSYQNDENSISVASMISTFKKFIFQSNYNSLLDKSNNKPKISKPKVLLFDNLNVSKNMIAQYNDLLLQYSQQSKMIPIIFIITSSFETPDLSIFSSIINDSTIITLKTINLTLMRKKLKEIIKFERMNISDDYLNEIIDLSDGDLRAAINSLELHSKLILNNNISKSKSSEAFNKLISSSKDKEYSLFHVVGKIFHDLDVSIDTLLTQCSSFEFGSIMLFYHENYLTRIPSFDIDNLIQYSETDMYVCFEIDEALLNIAEIHSYVDTMLSSYFNNLGNIFYLNEFMIYSIFLKLSHYELKHSMELLTLLITSNSNINCDVPKSGFYSLKKPTFYNYISERRYNSFQTNFISSSNKSVLRSKNDYYLDIKPYSKIIEIKRTTLLNNEIKSDFNNSELNNLVSIDELADFMDTLSSQPDNTIKIDSIIDDIEEI